MSKISIAITPFQNNKNGHINRDKELRCFFDKLNTIKNISLSYPKDFLIQKLCSDRLGDLKREAHKIAFGLPDSCGELKVRIHHALLDGITEHSKKIGNKLDYDIKSIRNEKNIFYTEDSELPPGSLAHPHHRLN